MKRTMYACMAAALLGVFLPLQSLLTTNADALSGVPTVSQTVNGDTTTTTSVYPCQNGKQTTVVEVDSPYETTTTSTTTSCSSGSTGVVPASQRVGIAASASGGTFGDGDGEVQYSLDAPAGGSLTGVSRVEVDGVIVHSVAASSEWVTVPLPVTLAAGTHRVDVLFVSPTGVTQRLSEGPLGAMFVKVAAATSRVSASVPSKAKKNTKVSASVSVDVPADSGQVVVYVNGKKVSTANVDGRSTVKMSLPKMSKGKKKVTFTYRGGSNVSGSSTTKTITVK